MRNKFRLVISLLILSIIIFTTYNVYDLSRKNSENQYNRLIQDLNSDTTDFTAWLSTKTEILNTAKDFVDNFTLPPLLSRKTLNPYLNINNDDPEISQIYIGLADGEFITGGEWVPPEDYDPRTRVWYREAVEAGKTIISDVYIDRETDDRTVTISSPLYMEDSFVGVISADVFMNDINNWLRNQISGENIYTYLLDSDGTVIVHTLRPNLVGTNIYNDDVVYDAFFARKDAFLAYFEKVQTSSNMVRMEYIAQGNKIRGIIRQVEEGDWVLAVAAVEDLDVFSFIKTNRNSITFNLLMLAVVLVLLQLVNNIKKELEQKNQLLTIDNELDFLTTIYNRRYFNLYIENLWQASESDSEICLLMLDIDYFKGYNDTYGHIMGDEVLKSVTQAINTTIRKQDIFARYGGEEFTLLLEQVSLGDAEKIAGKIVSTIYELNIENSASPTGRITISIGIASTTPGKAIGVRQFTNNADKALYKAKDKGRNTVVVFSGDEEVR